MRQEGILKHIAAALAIAVVFYFVGFSWIERRRAANGPWEITFRSDAAGVPALFISEIQAENQSNPPVSPREKHAQPLANHHIRPGHARSAFWRNAFSRPDFPARNRNNASLRPPSPIAAAGADHERERISVAFHQRDHRAVKKVLFVTGTDTGVGKTVLTAMLLAHLRARGRDALGMKPFCSGARNDARLLHSLQKGCLTLDEVNPFYFDKPLAPARAPKKVAFQDALDKICRLAARCEVLLVEGRRGSAGAFGERLYGAGLDLPPGLARPSSSARNRLGTINHTLLTAEALEDAGKKDVTVVHDECKESPTFPLPATPDDPAEGCHRQPVFCLPYLGLRAATAGAVKKNVKYLKKMLARLCGADNSDACSFAELNRLVNKTC